MTLHRYPALAPRVYYPRLNLAIVKTKQGKYKEAIELLDTLYKENATLNPVLVAYADALMAVNRLDEAEKHLLKVLADDKLDDETAGDARYKRSLLLNRRLRHNEAIKELAESAKILPRASGRRLPVSKYINFARGKARVA